MGVKLSRREFLKRSASASVAVSVAGGLGGLLGAARQAEGDIICNVPINNPHGPSKLGFHVVNGNPMDAYIQQLRDAGTYFRLIKCASDFGAAYSAKRHTPQTVTVGRWVGPEAFQDFGDPLREAEAKMKTHMEQWAKNRDTIDYWEVLNEPDPLGIAGHRRLGEFYMKCMEIAEKNGYKLAILSYSVGVPEWEEFEALVKLGVFEMAKAGGHILSLHEYNYNSQCKGWGSGLPGHPGYPDRGVLTGRYRWWYKDFLIPLNQVIPLAITEGGYDAILADPGSNWDWHDHYMDTDAEGLPWLDDRLREDDYVIGTALFTAGNWNDFYEYGPAELQNITNYVISKKNG
ncbi:MAG: hypothetical protein ACPL7O_11405 [Armatimonadota bacterium]